MNSSSCSSIANSVWGSRVPTGGVGRGEAGDDAGTASGPRTVSSATMASADGAVDRPGGKKKKN